MGVNPSQRNQNLYCTYHRDKGHTTEQCWVLKVRLGQLVKAGYLKEFVVDSRNRGARQGTQQKGNPLSRPLGVIEVIHATLGSLTAIRRKGVLTVVPLKGHSGMQSSEKRLKLARDPITFNDDDLEGTMQPRNDALVVTTQISGFLVKKVMVD